MITAHIFVRNEIRSKLRFAYSVRKMWWITYPDVINVFLLFFFQAEDGIRDKLVTGVQTCALPIWTECVSTSSRSRATCRRDRTRRGRNAFRPPGSLYLELTKEWVCRPGTTRPSGRDRKSVV